MNGDNAQGSAVPIRKPMDEIQGFSFGDLISDVACVMADFHVRATATFKGKEGSRGIMLVSADVVEGIINGLPEVLRALHEEGGDRDVLPPPTRPVPPWNAGPRGKLSRGRDIYICAGFLAKDIAPELGAAVIEIRTTSARNKPGKYDSGDYLMGWNALLQFQEALPKVLEQLRPYMTGKYFS
jgi:hypothetical protein